MTENNKLRALLAEARDALTYHVNEAEQRHEKERLIRPDRDLTNRIDAALAEPVVDAYDAAYAAMRGDAWQREALRFQRERDEARAEVERAYRRGAEAMREAAVSCAEGPFVDVPERIIASRIRALPIPEGE